MLAIMAAGVWSTRRMKVTGQVFFLAGRSLPWGIVGAALFASNISTIHLVGLTASGYNEGLVWGNFEWAAVFTLVLLALVFAPFYFRSRISTLPEFLERRYSPASRSFLAFMAIVAALFIHIGMSIFAGAAVFQRFFGIDVVTSIVAVAVVVSVYTLLGGLRAVVVTETINTVFLLAGACTITAFAIFALPQHGIHSIAQFKAALKPDQLSMLQTHSAVGLNWYEILLGFPILGIWYWCTDQTIVQRVLGARSERDAQLGPLMAGFLKILPVFVLVLPGDHRLGALPRPDRRRQQPDAARADHPAHPLRAEGSHFGRRAGRSHERGLGGPQQLRHAGGGGYRGPPAPGLSDRAQVNIARVSSAVVMILAVAWSTQGGRYSSIFEAINAIASDIAPPITTVFLFGVFWRRGTKEASLATLIFGFSLGAVRFLLDLPAFGSEKLITTGLGIPFLMQAWWGFCLCSIVFVVVSLLTPPPAPEKVEGLTWSIPSR